MADVGTQRPPAPPHTNAYHDMSNQEMERMLQEQDRQVEALSQEYKENQERLEMNNNNSDSNKTQLTQEDETHSKMAMETEQNTQPSEQAEPPAGDSKTLTPTRPSRPKSSGTTRARARMKSKNLNEFDDEIPSISSSSSSLSDSAIEQPLTLKAEVTATQDASPVAQETEEPEKVRRSSVSSTEDQEEGAAFRMYSANKAHTEEEDFDDYTITADQQKAMQELEKMKQEMDYLGEEDPPEYNVTELIKVLNQELAEEPMPDDSRTRAIKFKDNLVDVVAPPPDYSDDDDFEPETSAAVKTKTNANQDEGLGEDKLNMSDKENSDKSKKAEKSSSERSSKEDSDSSNSEKVLIEREGKFELVRASDVEAMDLGLGLAEAPSEEIPEEQDRGSPSTSPEHVPAPPSKPRPSTANGSVHRPAQANRYTRSQSASSPRHSDTAYETSSYVSPYGMSSDEKERKRKQDERREQKKKEDKENEKYESMQRKQENDEAFQAWLYKKRQEAAARRQSDKKESAEEAEEEERQSAFAEWLKVKKEKQKQDRQLSRQRKVELETCYYVRPREECEKAYKLWLKKKNEQVKKAQQQAKVQARYHRLLMRRSRKSQALAKAIRQAQTFRYVDVYGYRS